MPKNGTRPKFSKREQTSLTVKELQEQFPDRVVGVESYNNGKVAVIIPNGRIIFTTNQ